MFKKRQTYWLCLTQLRLMVNIWLQRKIPIKQNNFKNYKIYHPIILYIMLRNLIGNEIKVIRS